MLPKVSLLLVSTSHLICIVEAHLDRAVGEQLSAWSRQSNRSERSNLTGNFLDQGWLRPIRARVKRRVLQAY
jgi:hypothetical protein